MEIALFIQNIQEERAEVALYIFTNQTNSNLNQSIILSNNRCSSRNNHNNNSIITVILHQVQLQRRQQPQQEQDGHSGEVQPDGPGAGGGAHLAQCERNNSWLYNNEFYWASIIKPYR